MLLPMENRYSRQITLPGFGIESQAKLQAAKVLIIGCGGLGCPAANQLVRSGVGLIGLVDEDKVSLSNLHRQSLYTESQVGMPKVEAAKSSLSEVNSHSKLNTYPVRFGITNWKEMLSPYDIVLDCTDNFSARYLINDACVTLGKPLIYGAANQLEGQMAVFNVDGSGNLRDVFPEAPEPGTIQNCEVAGVLGPITGLIGNMMALEAIKLLTGLGEVLTNTLMVVDGGDLSMRRMKYPKRGSTISMAMHHGISWAEYRNAFGQHQLVDVRSSAERMPGDPGLHVSFPFEARAIEIIGEKSPVFYCQTGVRAEKALLYYLNQGHDVGFFINQGFI